jgi:putative ABC transport system ATP-binding protein
LADEPTGNLDTKTSIDVMEFFVNLNENLGKTIVLVTHEPDIAEYTKRILRFKDGKIIEDRRKG